MYSINLEEQISIACNKYQIDTKGLDQAFYNRLFNNISTVGHLFASIYEHHAAGVEKLIALIDVLVLVYKERSNTLKEKDAHKLAQGNWVLSNQIAGMSLYVDRFCGDLKGLPAKLDYLKKLGVNFLHLMPVFESPEGESDGGYAVADFRKVEERFGTMEDLRDVQQHMQEEHMYLMIDIVLNHTSHHHEWAKKARAGDATYQDYFYMFSDRYLPDQFDKTMPEIFPESAPGSFSYVPECDKWVMTVFHNYQWDLNYTNPAVFNDMLLNIFFYANLGVDILRIDAPAFIWKQLGTTCQNLPQAHTLLRLIKQCVNISTPGMALLGEVIVAPKEIMKYFGTDEFTAKECDVAYNATQMALQWDALATADTRVMLAAQHELLQKPFGTTWITYTRCHDDIGLGYDDNMIAAAGYHPYHHRKFLKDYYSGNHEISDATGALFSVNPKTQDARISGTLASLCGLEKAVRHNDGLAIQQSIAKIILMQAQTMFLGGIPMLFYGDEVGYTNDYAYQNDSGKSYDNRWMHRPMINWDKNHKIHIENTVEQKIFLATQKLIQLRKKLFLFGDYKNITWLTPHNIHVAGFIRAYDDRRVYCLFNYNQQVSFITWYLFKEHGYAPAVLLDHWTGAEYKVGLDHDYFIMEPYQFCILEAVKNQVQS